MGKGCAAMQQQTRSVPAEMLDQELESVNVAARKCLETTLELSQSDITVRNSYNVQKQDYQTLVECTNSYNVLSV